MLGNWSRVLIWFGVATLVAGLVVLTAVQTNVLLAYSLISLGLVLLIIGVALEPKTQDWLTLFWAQRSTQLSANGLLSAIAVLVIWACVNALAAQLSIRVDLTETQRFTLSTQTQVALQDIDHPLRIFLFQKTDDGGITPFLENYQRLNRKIRYQFVDPDIEIQLVQRFKVQSRGEVHLEYQGKTQLVQTLAQGEPPSEARLTNAIIRITGDRQPHLYILQGHGEPPISNDPNGLVQMVKALEEQGYRVNPLNLIQTPTLPEDADVIALIAPKSPLLPGEIKLLQTHLAQNRSLLILLEPNTDPQLDVLLAPLGIALDDRILVDGQTRADLLGESNTTILLTTYGDHPITNPLQDEITLFQFVRPLLLGSPTDATTTITPLLQGDRQIWAESNLPSPDATFDPNRDQSGPIPFGVALEWSHSTTEANTPETPSRLVVIGNANFATNKGFYQYLNSDLLLNSVNWLNKNQDIPLAIRPQSPQDRRLQLTGIQVTFIAWFAPIIVPLGGLAGTVILIRRRR